MLAYGSVVSVLVRVHRREEKLVRLLRVSIVRESPPALELTAASIRGWLGCFVCRVCALRL
jgi:hypothetical protein